MLRTLLNILQPPPNTPPTDDNGEEVEASCPPQPGPDPNIRLEHVGSITRIYGYPAKRPFDLSIAFNSFGGSADPILYLRANIPAYVNYIMGSPWHERLVSLDAQDGEFIPRNQAVTDKTADEIMLARDEEEEHCRRMLKCGAVLIHSMVDVNERDLMFSPGLLRLQPTEKQMFGWPTGGGVCVARAPPNGGTLEEDLERLNNDPEDKAQDDWKYMLFELRHAEDMEAVCMILMDAGGQYYENPQDCPEVRAIGL